MTGLLRLASARHFDHNKTEPSATLGSSIRVKGDIPYGQVAAHSVSTP